MRFMTMVEVSRPTPGRVARWVVAEGLVGGDVGGGDAEQVVGVAEEPFGVADLGDLGQAAFEVGDRGRVLSVHGHLDQDLEAEADGGGIDDSSVAADRPGAFQLAQSPVAGSDAEADPLGQLGYGQPPLRLKLSNDLPINRVHGKNHCRSRAIRAEIRNQIRPRMT